MKKYLNWNEICELSENLAEQIAKHTPDLQQVTLVAVARGGLIPTQLIAYRLGIRDIRLLKLTSYDDETGKRGDITDQSTDHLEDGKNVFFIDDLADSGQTGAYIRARFPHAKIGVLLTKTCCQSRPDFSAKDGFDADSWIVFPWD